MFEVYEEAINRTSEKLRTRFFQGLPSDLKVAFWKVRLALYLASIEMNVEQRSFVADLIVELNDGSLFDEHPGTRSAEVRLQQAASKLFSNTDVMKLFMSSTGSSPCESNVTSFSDPIDEEGSACTCLYTTWCQFAYDNYFVLCRTGNCDETASGCGILLSSPCVGRCTGLV